MAEADGCASHGLFRLPGYVKSLRSGKVDGAATANVSCDGTSIVRVDGRGGFAPTTHRALRGTAIDVARRLGVAVVTIRNVHHFSTLWADVEPFCDEGLCAMTFISYLPALAPAGGTKPLFGTNPMAFGWPRPNGRPMIIDQASSVVSRGDVMIAAQKGLRMPEGVGIDAAGKPTTDPNEILKGAMLPFGGYKGSAIALMVELLAGPLIGETCSWETAEKDVKDGGPPRGGQLMIVFSPERLGGANWTQSGEELFARILKQDNARLPADRRYVNRQRSEREGIDIPDDLVQAVNALGNEGAHP
jgi:delta1-piperideine-2-carboxylate reductase